MADQDRLEQRRSRWSSFLGGFGSILILFLAFGPQGMAAASWSLGGRPVPGPLPPNAHSGRPDLDIKLDVVYGVAAGVELKMDWAKPTLCRGQKVPAVLYIHGGGWTAGDKAGFLESDIATLLFQLGFAVGSINYRLAPEHIFPAQIHDCKLAVRYLRANADSLGINPDRIGVAGGSAGGHLVLLLGLTGPEDGLEGPGLVEYSSRVQAVVNHFGPTDLRAAGLVAHPAVMALLGCSPESCADRAGVASPVTYVTPGDAPIMTIHGENDSIVPYSQAVTISKLLRNVRNACCLIKVKNADHGFVPNPLLSTILPSLDRINWLTAAHLARFIEPALLGDLNMDGRVDWTDMFQLLSCLTMQGVGPDGLEAPDGWNPLADLSPDGIIDFQDISTFLNVLSGQGSHARTTSISN